MYYRKQKSYPYKGWGTINGDTFTGTDRPTIQCHRCRTTFSKGMTGADPVTQDEIIVASHLEGWFVTEEDKYCLACVQQMAERMNEHIENVRKIQDN